MAVAFIDTISGTRVALDRSIPIIEVYRELEAELRALQHAIPS